MHDNELNLDFYFYYLIIGILLTGLMAAILFMMGGRFLMDAFEKDEAFAKRTNVMLLVAFLLLNFGYIFLSASPNGEILSSQHLFEKLVWKIGVFIVVLGLEHVASLGVLYILRKNRQAQKRKQSLDHDYTAYD